MDRILLIEDRAEDAELTKLALTKLGFNGEFVWLKDGEEALNYLFGNDKTEALDTSRFKLILLDINLPKVNGLDVLKKIKESHLKAIPVIILTTSKESKDLKTAYDRYVNSYIVKPVNFDEFQEYVAKIGQYWINLNTIATV